MDLAWDITKWTPEQAVSYNRQWAARTFGETYADELAAIKTEYYRLAAAGKPEHVHLVKFTDQDASCRLNDYKTLAQRVDALKARIPASLQDAYYELIEYPVKSACYMNVKVLRARQSLKLAHSGQRDEALAAAAEATEAFRQIVRLTNHYNKEIAGGKWDGIMSYEPRRLQQFKMPPVATIDSISTTMTALTEETHATIIPARAYLRASAGVTTLPGLGIEDASVSVWPLDMKAYADSELSEAPYVEYRVPVKAGRNRVQVRCLPTFPINTDYDLRLALSVDGTFVTKKSIKTIAMKGWWHTTVVQGYADVSIDCEKEADGEVTLRVSMLDPGIVVSEIRSQPY